MTSYLYSNRKNEKIDKIPDFRVGSWIILENPTESQVVKISKEYSLETDLCLDALDPFELPRIEIENDVVYVFTRFATQNRGKVTTVPLLLIISQTFVMTICNQALPYAEKIKNSEIEISTTQKTKLLIQLLSLIHKSYQKIVTSIHKEIRNTSQNIERIDKKDIDNKDITKLVSFEVIFNDFIFGLEPTSLVLEKLLSGKFVKLFEEDKDLVEDLMTDHEQLLKICRSTLTAIKNIRESYSTVISNSLNKTMKLLTSLTLILTIPMMVSGFFGMNVAVPLEENPLAFFFIFIGTIFVTTALLFLFRKKDLL